jgi:hypothetical protein
MPQPRPESDALVETNLPCCQISAARTSPDVVWQPVVIYVPAPPTLTASPLLPSSTLLEAAADDSAPPVSSAQALLCTFLI